MQKGQSSAQRSFRRVMEFMAANTPADLSAKFATHMAELDDVMNVLPQLTQEQDAAQRSTLAETQRQKARREVLWKDHMLPIAGLAREAFGSPGVEEALRMPKMSADNDRVVAAARGMADAAEKHAELFTREALADDFVEQLRAAAQALADSLVARVESVRRRVRATAGVKAQVARGRRAVRKVSVVLRPRLTKDPQLAAAWANAKQLKEPGSGRTAAPVEGEVEIAKVA